MPRSIRYRDLHKQLTRLKERLLPITFDPMGQYSDRMLTRAIAYRVLAHAEFESYFEDRVKSIATTALTNFKTSGKHSQVLTALVAFSGRLMDPPPPSIEPPQPNQNGVWEERLLLKKKIDLAANSFFHIINTNNGIKEENILNLLVPVGYPVKTLDPVWLSQMNSFGKLRGKAAHQSCVFIVHNPDPKTEFNTVMELLKGLRAVDDELNNLA
jgi:hypothetical protein